MTVYPNVIFPALDIPTPSRQGQRGPKTGETDWTEARVATLREMWAAGKTQVDIALALGLDSRGAVSGKIARLGLSRVKPAPERPRGARSEKCAPTPYKSDAVLPEGRLTLAELDGDVCHFPVGDALPYKFCGEPTTGETYCPSCTAIAYRNPRHFRERKAFVMPF